MKHFTSRSRFSSSSACLSEKSSPARRAVTLCLVALLAAANIVLPASAQSEVVPIADKLSPWSADEGFVIYQNDEGETVCRDASVEEALTMPGRDTDIRLRRLNHPELELELENSTAKSVTSGGVEKQIANVESPGLKIVLEGTEQLTANPAATAAFQRAAAAWEAVIATPVIVRLKVDYGTNHFGTPWEEGSRTLGQTGSSAYRVPYTRLRQSLLDGASSVAEADLYQRLPATVVPTNLGTASDMSVTSALAQVFGFVASVPDDAVSSIAFNANFGFDFNLSDGIEAGKTDFHSVAVHEIGHALGFTSRAGSTELSDNTTQAVRLSVWDLFRFSPGVTLDAFTAAPRRVSSGETHIHYAGGTESQLSTGRPDGNGGDGRQSSHWKDDALDANRTYVGIMDPTISRSVAYSITRSDLAALDAFGYRLSGQGAPPPPPRPENNDFVAARSINNNSGTLTGTNVFATLEAGEPNHGGVPNGASVWYVWQAPASGPATFTTAGSNYDTTLGIYTGGAVTALSAVGGNDDVSRDDTTSIVTFNAVAGTIYRIAVDGYAGETGSLTLNWNLVGTTPPNPIDDAGVFAERHYQDFLSRPSDAPGLAFWTLQITQCGGDAVCIDRRRTGVSAAFFLSQEFQATGYYVYRLYKGALGRRPRFREFGAGVNVVAAGIVANNQVTPARVDTNKRAFAEGFVLTDEFRQRYPADGSMSNRQYVDKLILTTGIRADQNEINAFVAGLETGAETRASVLFKIVDGARTVQSGVSVEQVFETASGRAFYAQEYNPAFVQMQYFGYLRRDEDESGYQFWLAKLNRFGNYVDAEMVKAFIVSAEYRARFGQP